jgi:flagellar biosynthetic protein FlhB
MADRTEAPTPRRRQEARERGEIAKSPEVNSAIGMVVAFTLLRGAGPALSGRLAQGLVAVLDGSSPGFDSPESLRTFFLQTGLPVGLGLAPFILALMLAGVLASAAQTGLYFSGQALSPRWSRVNPLAGFRRLFSVRGLEELFKAGAKILVVGLVAYGALRGQAQQFLSLSSMSLAMGTATVWRVVTDVGVRVGMVMLVIALADYLYQRRQLEQNLRMTKQELVEELKRYENPVIRSRIRQQQRRMAMQRMMAAVPKADVVITNPTEFAVAIAYDPADMRAPKVVAKGQRLVAERIRRLAKENGVPIVERRPVARALYRAVEVGHEIPAELYQAVAEVLAFIYSLRSVRT